MWMELSGVGLLFGGSYICVKSIKFVIRTADEIRNYEPQISDAMFLVDRSQLLSRQAYKKQA
jgi:hypothetical protein